MRFVMFTHSLVSDWNHGNAHFLRGVCSELIARGHSVKVYEPRDAWSVMNLVNEHGDAAIARFHEAYPELSSERYDLEHFDFERALSGADIVLVHEWNGPEVVRRVGEQRARNPSFKLFFHDTHHRAITAPAEMARFDLRHYDGVLAFGEVLRQIYLQRSWAQRAWTWHEAADIRRFKKLPVDHRDGDVVWIGNWGDEERTAELREFLLEPVKALRLKSRVHGVRYPDEGKRALKEAGIQFGGWLPNFEVPETLAKFAVTVHIPRRPYVKALPGIPTIRPFEAMACGIPLVSAPWNDAEALFKPGEDFLVARDGEEMKRHLSLLLSDPTAAKAIAERGRRTILARHTCAHRVDELLRIHQSLVDERKVATP